MHKCTTPNCLNQIEGNKKYCDDCLAEFKARQGPHSGKYDDSYIAYQFEWEQIEGAIGCKVECQMSRGPAVRGILRGFDRQYGKILIEENLGVTSRTTIVKLGYVSSFAIFKPNNAKPSEASK